MSSTSVSMPFIAPDRCLAFVMSVKASEPPRPDSDLSQIDCAFQSRLAATSTLVYRTHGAQTVNAKRAILVVPQSRPIFGSTRWPSSVVPEHLSSFMAGTSPGQPSTSREIKVSPIHDAFAHTNPPLATDWGKLREFKSMRRDDGIPSPPLPDTLS